MPSVPFSGVPQVGVSAPDTPRYSADAPIGAFGGSVAAATHGLGKQIEGAGNELFQRGLAMQDLFNHSEAQEADAKYMESAGKLHAEYSSLEGKDAVAAYPKYIQSLKDTRKAIGEGLSNDMSRKLFDAQSLSTMGRSIFNGAGHSATENKKYAINSTTSEIQNQTDLAATSGNPSDVAAARTKIKELSGHLAGLKGLDDNSATQQEKIINSSLDFNVIKQMARTSPVTAKDELEKRRGSMTAADFDRAQTIVDNSARSVGSVNIAQKVIETHAGEDGKITVPFETMQKEAEAEAKRLAPDDAVMQKHTVDALRGLYNQKVYADKQFRWETTQTVDAAIQNGVRDIQQLRADPQVAAAIDSLPKSEQLKLPARINAYNAARDKVGSQESLTRLTGLRNNDVESFLNLDPADPNLHLNQAQQREVLNWQRQDKKNQNGDPRVNQALGWLRQARGTELSALGVFKRDAKNPEDYDHMTGTLQSALELWRENKGKPAEYKDVVEVIGPQIIQSRSVAGAWWGTNKEPFFKPDYHSDEYKLFKRKASEDMVNQGASAPTEAEIDRAYTRMQLLKLYPKKSTSADGK